LLEGMPLSGFIWLVAGGICFTVGAGFYAWKSRRYTHTIFHLFVLAGSICHFVSIYGFVLPDRA
ncbi:MAG: hemolysin III family protein, partial [Pseudomonadota bacterium]